MKKNEMKMQVNYWTRRTMKIIRKHASVLLAILTILILLNRFIFIKYENNSFTSWDATSASAHIDAKNIFQNTATSHYDETIIKKTTVTSTFTSSKPIVTTEKIANKTVKESITTTKNRTFYFVETSNTSHFTAREACAVESVARIHPTNPVRLFYIAKDFNLSNPLVNLLLQYKNFQFSEIDLDRMMKGSPLEPWIKDKPWMKSQYNVSHLSDVMRTLLMWKYGGVYMDLDIVALRPLDDLKNAIGLQSTNYVAAGVLVFEKSHPVVNASIHELFKTYRAWSWGYNGPELYFRVLKQLCNVSNFTDLPGEIKNCAGVLILPPSAFYPIFYPSWRKYFQNAEAAETIIKWLQQKSYLLHIWNKLAEKEPLIIGSGQPYDLASKYYCPKVYQQMKPLGKM